MLMFNFPAHAQQSVSRRTMVYASYIRGQDYPLQLVDETFRNQPTYSLTSPSAPPLDMVAAYQLAHEQFPGVKEPNIEYDVDNISLGKYFDTDWWFYVVTFRASRDWKTAEPYRSLLQDKARNVHHPCIKIIVLMNGETIVPQQAGPAYPPQGVGSADP